MANSKSRRGQAKKADAVPVVQWFDASHRGRTVMLALLTEAGPDAYVMSPVNANLMGDALREAAESASRQRD